MLLRFAHACCAPLIRGGMNVYDIVCVKLFLLLLYSQRLAFSRKSLKSRQPLILHSNTKCPHITRANTHNSNWINYISATKDTEVGGIMVYSLVLFHVTRGHRYMHNTWIAEFAKVLSHTTQSCIMYYGPTTSVSRSSFPLIITSLTIGSSGSEAFSVLALANVIFDFL